MTHTELVTKGRMWLAKRCPIVITELASDAGECPDVIGFHGRTSAGYGTHMIECKASVSDFKADARKPYRRNPAIGMGNYRYYLTPKGLLDANAIPENWGLLEVHDNGRIFTAVTPQRQPADRDREVSLLVSTIRRLNIPEGNHTSLHVKSYTIDTKNRSVLEIHSDDDLIPQPEDSHESLPVQP